MSVAAAQLLVMAIALYWPPARSSLSCFSGAGSVALIAAAEGTLGFRVLVFPGVTVFWPALCDTPCSPHARPPDEWTAHDDPATAPSSSDRRDRPRRLLPLLSSARACRAAAMVIA